MTNVRVVGTALFPEADDGSFNNALGLSERGYAEHVGQSESTCAIVTVSPGHDVADVAPISINGSLTRCRPTAFRRALPTSPSLDGLRSFPRALAAVAILLGSAVLLNMLLATRHRRRRELATLASLGLTSRGLRNCVVWQSVGVVAVSAVLGIAAGIAAGAAVWIATTDGIGVATDVNRPLLAIGMWSSIACSQPQCCSACSPAPRRGSTSPSRSAASDPPRLRYRRTRAGGLPRGSR